MTQDTLAPPAAIAGALHTAGLEQEHALSRAGQVAGDLARIRALADIGLTICTSVPEAEQPALNPLWDVIFELAVNAASEVGSIERHCNAIRTALAGAARHA